MSDKLNFCTEVARIVSSIDEPRFAWPLIHSPLEPFLSPLIRSEFLVGKSLLLKLAPDLMLPHLVSSSSLDDQALAAASPNCTQLQLEALLAQCKPGIDQALAGNQALPPTLAAALAERSPLLMATSESCPEPVLAKLGQSRNSKVRLAVAENSRCDLDIARAILKTFAGDRSASIRRRVVECLACDRETFIAVDTYSSRSGSDGSFDLWLAIARHAECGAARRVEIFQKLAAHGECFVLERPDSRYSISDARLDLLKLPECPSDVQKAWLDELSRDRDDRYALELVKLPVCPPDLLTRLSVRLQKSRSRFVQAALGDRREAAIADLRRAAEAGGESELNSRPPASPEPTDWAEVGRQALGGDMRAMREAVSNADCPEEVRIEVSRHVVERAFRTSEVSELESFSFRFERPFKDEKNCPVSFLRLASATDASLIKRALGSKHWLHRAALTFNHQLPATVMQKLRNDEHEVVKGLALDQL